MTKYPDIMHHIKVGIPCNPRAVRRSNEIGARLTKSRKVSIFPRFLNTCWILILSTYVGTIWSLIYVQYDTGVYKHVSRHRRSDIHAFSGVS